MNKSTRGDDNSAHPLLHPVSLFALGLLIVNDHVLKQSISNSVTGKLSDFAGLVFFPILLSTMLTLKPRRPSNRVVVLSIVTVGVLFASINTIPAMEYAYEQTLGMLQTPFRLLLGRGTGPVALTRDPTDLFALLALPVPWLIARRHVESTSASETHPYTHQQGVVLDGLVSRVHLDHHAYQK